MNIKQQNIIEKIKSYVIKHDCFNNDSNYEIKQWEIEDCGKFVSLYVESGMKNDSGTAAAILCRKTRQIFIGIKGGVRTHICEDGVCKTLKGWDKTMIYGARN